MSKFNEERLEQAVIELLEVEYKEIFEQAENFKKYQGAYKK